jgi:2-amino-4-hydroxy-6-hydroxymethyldihydropteridine diphosphokinase
MTAAFIALGSNLTPEDNLHAALRLLRRRMTIAALSRVYRTPPWGYADQPPFLNAVARAETDLPPEALLDALQAVEAECGRVRDPAVRYGPRTLDLDLLAVGAALLDTERLTLPHPRMHERAFVLLPLCDLAPDWVHPRLGLTARVLLARTDRTGIEEVAWDWEVR